MSRPIRIAYGKHNESGEILHISAASRGLACACVCVGCGAPLVARKGPQLGPHFAHYRVAPCANAPETALHAWAKAVIARDLRVMLPGHSERIDGRGVDLLRRAIHHFDSADVEISLAAIRPDVIAVRTGQRLAIEIKVTHGCSPEKIAYFKEQDVSAVEIDLSKLPRDAGPEAVADAVINTAPRVWLHNRKLEEKRAQAIAKIDARRANTAPRYPLPYSGGPWGDTEDSAGYNIAQKAEASLRVLERVNSDHDPHGHRACLKSLNLEALLSGDVYGAGAFKVLPKVWQAALVWDFLLNGEGRRGRHSEFTDRDCINKLMSRNMVQKDMCEFIHPAVEEIAGSQKHPFVPPYRTMRSFMLHLERHGAIAKPEDYWKPSLPPRIIQAAHKWHQQNYGAFQYPP